MYLSLLKWIDKINNRYKLLIINNHKMIIQSIISMEHIRMH